MKVLKRVFAIAGLLIALRAFSGCEKEDILPELPGQVAAINPEGKIADSLASGTVADVSVHKPYNEAIDSRSTRLKFMKRNKPKPQKSHKRCQCAKSRSTTNMVLVEGDYNASFAQRTDINGRGALRKRKSSFSLRKKFKLSSMEADEKLLQSKSCL